jgi:cell division protein FtsI/penicillin-binding protein 2
MLTSDAQRIESRRLLILGLALTLGLSIIVGQLVRLTVGQHTELKAKAEAERLWEVEVPPVRGYIADANGKILAMDVTQWDISVSPPLVDKSEAGALADHVAPLLDLPRDELYTQLVSDADWILLARGVDQETGETIAEMDESGIKCEPRAKRVYPEGSLACHVLGFVNDTGKGFYGVEGNYNNVLCGVVGKEQIEQDPGGEPLPIPAMVENPPKPGTNLVLTLDSNIQYIVEEELARALEEYGAVSGTVIVMKPDTGALLAVASYPNYDPNHFADADAHYLADPSVSGMFEPGSIFKIITWSGGLDSGTISPGTTFYDSGALEVGGRVMLNSDRQGHGQVTMTDGLVQSLNTVAAYISTSMGKDRFYTYLRRFGFGDLTKVDLASEGPGMMKQPGDSNWFPSELGTNSFGQGIAVTPMQMIAAVAAVANQGRLMKPYIVQQYLAYDEETGGERTIQVEPMLVRKAISPESAQTLTNMLVQVVEGMANKAQVPGYTVAGKTGTAQIPTPYGYHPTDTIASFVGWVPADDPAFIILIKLDKPTTASWGSQTAAPTFRAIAEQLLIYLQIPPDDIRLAQH